MTDSVRETLRGLGIIVFIGFFTIVAIFGGWMDGETKRQEVKQSEEIAKTERGD